MFGNQIMEAVERRLWNEVASHVDVGAKDTAYSVARGLAMSERREQFVAWMWEAFQEAHPFPVKRCPEDHADYR